MAWIVAQFLGVGRWLRWLGGIIARVAMRYPWQCALVVALLAAGWEHHGKVIAEGQRDALKAQIAQMQAATKAAEQRSVARAKENTDVHTTVQHESRDATQRYVDAHTIRVPVAPSSAAPEGSGAGLPAFTAPDTIVVTLSSDDALACGDDYSYALSAYLWAKSKVDAGDAVYEK